MNKYIISQNQKRIDCKNPISGHEWSEYRLIPNSYSVFGFMAISSRKFKSEKAAQLYIDALIRFEQIAPFTPTLRSLDGCTRKETTL